MAWLIRYLSVFVEKIMVFDLQKEIFR